MKEMITILLLLSSTLAHSQVVIEYFFQPGCPECEKVKAFIIPQLEEMYKGKYKIIEFDINKEENIPKLVEYQDKFNIEDDEPVSMVVAKKHFLSGYDKIEEQLFDKLAGELNKKEKQPFSNPTNIKKSKASSPEDHVMNHFKSFRIPAVISAGLLDGINPCVFSALVFFISLLSVSNIKRRKLAITGSVYCLACFLSYLALGFGLFRFLKLFSGYKAIQVGVNYTMAAVLIILAYFSFRDAFRFHKSGKASDVEIQLPDKLKQLSHSIMKKGLSYKHLIPGAFLIGVAVTAIESVCTGQIYVPTLVLLSKTGNLQAFIYLIIYNIAFIIPLIIVFVIAYKGISTPKLIQWSKTNVFTAKTMMGCLFIAMAILMFFV